LSPHTNTIETCGTRELEKKSSAKLSLAVATAKQRQRLNRHLLFLDSLRSYAPDGWLVNANKPNYRRFQRISKVDPGRKSLFNRPTLSLSIQLGRIVFCGNYSRCPVCSDSAFNRSNHVRYMSAAQSNLYLNKE
jgi:hypothetical protein